MFKTLRHRGQLIRFLFDANFHLAIYRKLEWLMFREWSQKLLSTFHRQLLFRRHLSIICPEKPNAKMYHNRV